MLLDEFVQMKVPVVRFCHCCQPRKAKPKELLKAQLVIEVLLFEAQKGNYRAGHPDDCLSSLLNGKEAGLRGELVGETKNGCQPRAHGVVALRLAGDFDEIPALVGEEVCLALVVAGDKALHVCYLFGED